MILKLKLLFNNVINLCTKILSVLPLIDLIKKKLNQSNDLINKIKDKIYFRIFGRRLGTFTEKGHLLFPIIILNNKLLLELDDDSSRCTKFIRSMFNIYQIFRSENKYLIYENKLVQILQGKENKEKFPVYFDGNIYKKLTFSKKFTVALYNEWEKDPEFLTYVICYYLLNYVFDHDEVNFDTDFIDDWNYREEYITLDLSPFFIYQGTG
jgi:hypothetical protein